MEPVSLARPDAPSPSPMPFEPLPAFRTGLLENDAELADNRGKRIGILIVTYNAVTTVTRVLKRITPAVWKNVEEIAIFDDSSQDSTYELAMGVKMLRDLPKLHVIRHEKNLGYGGNQKAGYRYFMEKGFDVVVLLHGDGQYAPEFLSSMYHPLVTGEADAVFGSRMMKTYGGPLKGGMPLYKFVGNRILTIFENRALDLNLTEFHSGYRAYNLHALADIRFDDMTNDFHFDTEIIIKLHHQGFTIREVPIPTFYGDELCYVNGTKYAWDVFKAVQRYKKTIRSARCYPEFQEYYVPYPVKVSRYSTHDYVRRLVGSSHDVLQLASGDGHFGAELRKTGNRVTGVGPTPPSEALDEFALADLETGLDGAVPELRDRRFDRVLLIDVLEHLRDPERILRECQALLRDNGQLIVSVPNAANITVRLMLLFGHFEYADRGILDRTHVRFFTWKSVRRLLERTGYRVSVEKVTVVPLELVTGLDPERFLMRAINRFLWFITGLMPSLLGYEIVLAARKRA
ncbi:MAG TPA: bifunctional glycosyltransferase/class I SAM-dependent methyltransferase [Bryobacteraceae bacterium]|nr:bifunctional glycosyltransferase/class I SAM-dependent methyltransferase [Bryobacteraceae bacterium]